MPRLWYNRIAARAVDGFFATLARAGRLAPASRAHRHNLIHERDVRYQPGGDQAHLLDVYRPEGPGPFPCILYLHGGGFRALSKDTHYLMGLAYARAGFAVFCPNYRLAPKSPFPAAIEDACAAYTWLTRNAASYGGEPTNIGVAGESAGANLAASLVVAACFERPEPYAHQVYETGIRPRFAIPACGIFQVSDCARFGEGGLRNKLIRAVVRDVEDAYLADPKITDTTMADPLLVFESQARAIRPLPPFFLPVGGRDPLLIDSQRLHRALCARGGASTCEVYPGEVHAFHAFIWRAQARQCWRQSLAFAQDAAVTPM